MLAQGVAPRSDDRREGDRCVSALAQVREAACWPPLVDELLDLLRADEPSHRASASRALEWLGPKAAAPAIVERLEELLADADRDVRFHARDALDRLRPSPA